MSFAVVVVRQRAPSDLLHCTRCIALLSRSAQRSGMWQPRTKSNIMSCCNQSAFPGRRATRGIALAAARVACVSTWFVDEIISVFGCVNRVSPRQLKKKAKVLWLIKQRCYPTRSVAALVRNRTVDGYNLVNCTG